MTRYPLFLIVPSFMFTACMQEPHETRSTDQGEVESISQTPEFSESQAQLTSWGYAVDRDQAVVHEQGANYAVVFPVQYNLGQLGEYESMVYLEDAAGPFVALELTGYTPPANDDAVLKGHAPERTCGTWTQWHQVGQWCNWHPTCSGDATMVRRERKRECTAGKNAGWTEYDQVTVRLSCGC